MMFEHTSNTQKNLDTALLRFGLGVSDAAEELADTIRMLPDAHVVPDDGAELDAALHNFEVAFQRVFDVLHKTLSGGRDAH